MEPMLLRVHVPETSLFDELCSFEIQSEIRLSMNSIFQTLSREFDRHLVHDGNGEKRMYRWLKGA